MAHGDAREGKWRGNWRMEWVSSTLHTTSEHGVSSITTADEHTSAASSRLYWRPRRFKWTHLFRLKTKSGFCACAITFQTQSIGVKKAWSFASTLPYLLVAWRLSKHKVTEHLLPIKYRFANHFHSPQPSSSLSVPVSVASSMVQRTKAINPCHFSLQHVQPGWDLRFPCWWRQRSIPSPGKLAVWCVRNTPIFRGTCASIFTVEPWRLSRKVPQCQNISIHSQYSSYT
jgi:hypothetical protein